MTEPDNKFKDVIFILDRYGPTLVFCAFLAWVLTHQLKDLKWQNERMIRNTRAIMQKMDIPVTFDSDDKRP